MSDISDLFNSLDASDLDEIAGKLKVTPITEGEDCECEHEKENKKKLDKIPAQLDKSTKKHAKQAKDLRAAGIGEQVSDLFTNYEVPKTAVSIPAPQKVRLPQQQQTSRRDSLIENAARAISHVAKNDAKVESKPLREDRSLEDRMKLLEQDLFRVQAQATPNTLVAGIGASLDSGGGAVWLWDLEDINIGVPYTDPTTGGTKYPNIANGSILKYNSGANQWIVGAPGTAGGVTTADVFLLQEIPVSTLQAAMNTLPTPENDVVTQADANTWFQAAIIDIDSRLGGEDQDLEVVDELDFVGSDEQQDIRKYSGGSNPAIGIKIGDNENDLTDVHLFTQTQSTSFVDFGITKTYPVGLQTANETDQLFSVQFEDASATKTPFKITPLTSEFDVITTFKNIDSGSLTNPSGDATYAINNTWAVEGAMAPTSGSGQAIRPILYRINNDGSTYSSIRYQGLQTHVDDVATVGYVNDNAGGDFLPLTGGTLTGDLTMKADIKFTGSGRRITFKDNTYNSLLFSCADGTTYFGLDSQDGAGDEDHSIFFNVPLNIDNTADFGANISFNGTNQTVTLPDASNTALTFQYTDASASDAVKEMVVFDTQAGQVEIPNETDVSILSDRVYFFNPTEIRLGDNNTNALKFEIQAGSARDLLAMSTKNDNEFIATQVRLDSRFQLSVENAGQDGSRGRIRDITNSMLVTGYIGNLLSDGNLNKGDTLLKTIINPSYNQDDNDPPANPVVDSIEYYGLTTNTNSLMTRTAVSAMINSGGEGTVFHFRGKLNATIAGEYPSGVDVGDYYMNTTAGTADNLYVGIAGESLSVNQLIIFTANTDENGAATPWVTGASSAPADVYVPLAGASGADSMTGTLNVNVGSGDALTVGTTLFTVDSTGDVDANSITTVAGGTIGSDLSVAGATTLSGTVTAGPTTADSLTVTNNGTVSGNLEVTGTSTLTGNVSAAGTLDVTGNSTLGGTLAVTGASTFGAVDAGKIGTLFGRLDISAASAGTATGNLRMLSSGGAENIKINNSTGNIVIQTANKETDINLFGNAEKTLRIRTATAAVGESPTYRTNVEFSTTENIFKRNFVVNGNAEAGGAILSTFKRSTQDSYNQFIIKGITTSDLATVQGNLFVVERNETNAVADEITYHGGTSNANNIMTKTAVETLINNIDTDNLLEGGIIRASGGTANTSGNLILQQTAVDGAAQSDARLYIKDSGNTTNITMFPSGQIELGTQLKMGASLGTTTDGVLTNNSLRKIVCVGTGSLGSALSIQNSSTDQTTFTEGMRVGGTTVRVYRTFAVGESDTLFTVNKTTGSIDKMGPGIVNTSATDNRQWKFDGSTDPKLRFNFKGTGDSGYAESFVANKNGVTIKSSSEFALTVGDNSGDEYFKVKGASGNVAMGSVLELGRYTSQEENMTNPEVEIYAYGSHDTTAGNQKFGKIMFYGNDGLGNGQSTYTKVEYGRWTSANLLCKTPFKLNDGNSNTIEMTTNGNISTQGQYINLSSSTTTTQTIRAFGRSSKTLEFQVSNGTSSGDFVTPMQMTVSQTKFPRLRGSLFTGEDWAILGNSSQSSSFDVSSYLLSVYRNSSSSGNLDAVNYYGRVEGADNIQTKSSVQDLINAGSVPVQDLFYGGTIKSDGGSASTTGNLTLQATGSGGSLFLKNSAGSQTLLTLSSTGKITNTATDSTSQQWASGSRNASLQFVSTCSDAAIAKIGGKNSSNQDYNRFQIFCGSNNSSATAGTKNAMLSVINSNGTYLAMLAPNSRAEFDADIATVGYVNTTSIQGTVTTTPTNSTDPISGQDVVKYVQTAVTVPADVTFDGALHAATPSANTHVATKAYVDSHSNGISGGQQSGTWTATFSGTSGSVPSSGKQTATGHYRKIGDLTHVTLSVTGLNLTGYAGAISIEGLPFKPDMSIAGGTHIGKIHAVNFMVNNFHADDGFVSVATYDSTHGSHIAIFSEQVSNLTHYITNTTNASVIISITYIAE